MPIAAGQRLGPYEILAPIGAGGMGEVYRAKDTKLKREVALKVLPDSFASDPERMARFQREAEVLASLNHPNIAQIYGVEERALVIELVPGEPLKGPLPLKTVLDFGLAAMPSGLVGDPSNPANSPTLTISPTRAGMILGTAAYMSPEQARASPVDKRTDVWAFGALLYEMLTGKAAFAGDTVTDILASVVKEQPDLSALPAQVRTAVGRCLSK